jgi:glycosyltransferase involved in cell wall biosynthesis
MTTPTPLPPITVVVLTLNEEANILACLASCAWCDDVHVVDSGSTDRTVELARAHGATVHTNPFRSFGQQRNWAIDNIAAKHDWVFHLDADERFTPELVEEIARVLDRGTECAGFYVPSRLMFMGKWLRRAGSYPTYQMRFFDRRKARFRDHGHGQREETGGRIGTLGAAYLHYNFSKGIEDWLEKHNRYSTREALQILASRREPLRLGDLLGDAVQRRRAMKRLWYRLPLRAWLRWGAILFFSGGVLEGAPARTYAAMMALYERMIDLKLAALEAEAGATRGSTDAGTRVIAVDRPLREPLVERARIAEMLVDPERQP